VCPAEFGWVGRYDNKLLVDGMEWKSFTSSAQSHLNLKYWCILLWKEFFVVFTDETDSEFEEERCEKNTEVKNEDDKDEDDEDDLDNSQESQYRYSQTYFSDHLY
jgi:hypothetical protein